MTRRLFVLLAFLVWLAVFAISIIGPMNTEATGDGFARGLNRISAFLGWQLLATIIAVFVFIVGLRKPTLEPLSRWASRLPLMLQGVLVLFFVGLVAYLNLSKPDPEPYEPPATGPTPPAQPVTGFAPQPPEDQALVKFEGIYRSGFEASHFYTMDGKGPYWLEADPGNWETLQSFRREGPGRSGVVTLALSFQGWTGPADSSLSALPAIEKRIHLVAIDNIRPLAPEEFQRILTTVQRRANQDNPAP